MSTSYALEGRHAVVTGGAKGIGRAIAELLLASGCRVLVWDASPAAVPGAESAVVDVTRVDQVMAAAAALNDRGRLDILVNDAGHLGRASPFVGQNPADWRQIFEVNILGAMQVTQALLPIMIRQRAGWIINLGSLAGKEGAPGIAAYSAASAGVIAFTKALSREVAPHNVLVNCVAPGPIETDMIRGLGDEVVQQMAKDSPLGRLGTPGEVAQLVAWLCTDACTFSTGAVYDVSGGRARY